MSPAGARTSPSFARALIAALLALGFDALLLALALGGFAALRAQPVALALLATWGAGGLALAWLRPVGAAEHVTRRPDAGVMVLLLLLPLFTPAVSAWGMRQRLWLLPDGIPWGWAGVGLVAAGLALRIAAMARLGSRFSPMVAVQPGHVLETRGVYARVRHPGYLGAWLAALGAALAFGSGIALPLVAAFLLVLLVRIGAEERLLAEHLGAAWTDYAATRGSLWPRLRGS